MGCTDVTFEGFEINRGIYKNTLQPLAQAESFLSALADFSFTRALHNGHKPMTNLGYLTPIFNSFDLSVSSYLMFSLLATSKLGNLSYRVNWPLATPYPYGSTSCRDIVCILINKIDTQI